MFIKLKLQTFWILLLVVSSLWVAVGFGSLLLSALSPAADVWAIVHAMQGRQDPPPKSTAVVQTALDGGGRLGRVIHVTHYAAVGATFRNGDRHRTRMTEDGYLAWFQKIPRPILLVLRRYELDGTLQGYEVGSAEATRLIPLYGPPLLAFAVSLYLVRKRKSPLLSDPASISDRASR
jgi:hypothetical protein